MFALLATAALSQTGPDTNVYYKLAPDAVAQDGVPKGEIRGPFTLPSEGVPGDAAYLLDLCAGAV